MLFGQFTLWRSRKFAGVIFDIACSNRVLSNPEPRIADNVLIGSNPIQIGGIWFRASQPIVPSKKLRGFLSQVDNLLEQPSGWAIKKSVEAIGIKASGDGFPLALGYPDHLEEERWLFLWCQFPKDRSKRYSWSSPQNLNKIEVKGFQTAPASKDALLRRSAYISNSLVSKRLVLFGVGAVGSSIALLLAKAGIGELRLVDSDHLIPGNITRHICGLDWVGLPKTAAVKSILRRHNPDINIECYEATWEVNKLRTYGQNCDLVVDATGNTNFSRHLNRVCVELNRPILFAAAYRRASIGRIISRIDKSDPCLECYLAYPNAWSSDEYPIIPTNPDESFIEDGCGSVTEEAIALDVEAVANFGTRSIIRLLREIHNRGNLGIVINEPLLDSDFDLFHFTGTHYRTNEPNPRCKVCGA
jgi:molybdopterin/thiamine biosynthesis adenylyltransferase